MIVGELQDHGQCWFDRAVTKNMDLTKENNSLACTVTESMNID